MSTKEALVPLRKTLHSLREIRSALVPYLCLLKGAQGNKSAWRKSVYSSGGGGKDVDPHRVAEARTAVALAAGTLRYMSARLRGNGVEGRKKDDPLRMELDKTRKMLVTLRGLEKQNRGGSGGAGSGAAAVAASSSSGGKATSMAKSMDPENLVLQPAMVAAPQDPPQSAKKLGKVIDVPASERMVKAALSGPSAAPSIDIGGTDKAGGYSSSALPQSSSSPLKEGKGGGKGKKSRSRSRSRSPIRGDREENSRRQESGEKKKNKKQRI